MRELREIAAAWAELERTGGTGVLASIVHVEGSTYRRPGARVLVLPDDTMLGLLSGGCLEGDLLERARGVRETGTPERVRYDGTQDEDIVWGLGLGCAGIVDVLLEPVSATRPGPLPWLVRCLSTRAPMGLATVVRATDALALAQRFGEADAPAPLRAALAEVVGDLRPRTLEHAGGELLVEAIVPPLPLFVFGAGPDAVPLVRLASELGWDVTLVDGRPAYARAERFPTARVILAAPDEVDRKLSPGADAAAVVMTHHYLNDRALVGWLLSTPVRYLGLLGPRQRALDLVRDLREEGHAISEEAVARLHAPAGLDIGSETPEEIALSLLAEIRGVFAERSGGPLRLRKGPIHDPVG